MRHVHEHQKLAILFMYVGLKKGLFDGLFIWYQPQLFLWYCENLVGISECNQQGHKHGDALWFTSSPVFFLLWNTTPGKPCVLITSSNGVWWWRLPSAESICTTMGGSSVWSKRLIWKFPAKSRKGRDTGQIHHLLRCMFLLKTKLTSSQAIFKTLTRIRLLAYQKLGSLCRCGKHPRYHTQEPGRDSPLVILQNITRNVTDSKLYVSAHKWRLQLEVRPHRLIHTILW